MKLYTSFCHNYRLIYFQLELITYTRKHRAVSGTAISSIPIPGPNSIWPKGCQLRGMGKKPGEGRAGGEGEPEDVSGGGDVSSRVRFRAGVIDAFRVTTAFTMSKGTRFFFEVVINIQWICSLSLYRIGVRRTNDPSQITWIRVRDVWNWKQFQWANVPLSVFINMDWTSKL